MRRAQVHRSRRNSRRESYPRRSDRSGRELRDRTTLACSRRSSDSSCPRPAGTPVQLRFSPKWREATRSICVVPSSSLFPEEFAERRISDGIAPRQAQGAALDDRDALVEEGGEQRSGGKRTLGEGSSASRAWMERRSRGNCVAP